MYRRLTLLAEQFNVRGWRCTSLPSCRCEVLTVTINSFAWQSEEENQAVDVIVKIIEIPFPFLIAQGIHGNVLHTIVHYQPTCASKNTGFMLSHSTEFQFPWQPVVNTSYSKWQTALSLCGLLKWSNITQQRNSKSFKFHHPAFMHILPKRMRFLQTYTLKTAHSETDEANTTHRKVF